MEVAVLLLTDDSKRKHWVHVISSYQFMVTELDISWILLVNIVDNFKRLWESCKKLTQVFKSGLDPEGIFGSLGTLDI